MSTTHPSQRPLRVLPLPGSEAGAQAYAVALRAAGAADVAVVDIEHRRFPDGERYLRLQAGVAGADCWLFAQLRDPDPQALSLWFLADAARELGAARVGLAAPYLPYMRQDIRFRDGEAVTSRSFAAFVSARFDALVTVDPHLHRHPTLAAVYTIPATAVASAPALARWIAAEVRDPVLIGPDEESGQWVHDVAARVGCPALVLAKTRHGDRDVQVSVPDAAAHAGRHPVLLDDIVSSAHTMAQAVRRVRAAWPGAQPTCVGVHALFEPGALALLQEAGAGRVASSNTLPHATNAVDVLGELAQAALGCWA